jgi:nicotinate-nucleotide adenylyltransferase
MPTGAPRYRKPAVASAEDRLMMLGLALAAEPRFAIDARELAAGHSGYTVDTLASLRKATGPDTELYFLMGADQLEKLDSWHRPDEVRKLAKIAVFARPGHAATGAETIPMKPNPISASDIRARAARGEDVAGFVPPEVASYISAQRLYR